MAARIFLGATLGYSTTPHNGTFPGALTYATICCDQFPVVGENSPEIETTDSCDTAETYIKGLAQGAEFSVGGFIKASNAADFAVGAGKLPALAKSGAVMGVRLNLGLASNNFVYRFDVTPLSWEQSGGSVKDPMKWMFKGRITGSIDIAAT